MSATSLPPQIGDHSASPAGRPPQLQWPRTSRILGTRVKPINNRVLPIENIHDITAPHLTALLREVGALSEGSVTALQVEPIGTGQMAEAYRIGLTYSDAPGPSSLVLKCGSQNDTSRATGAALRAYEIEVRFYQEVAPLLAVEIPRSYGSAISDLGDSFALWLEDCSPAVQGDQLIGCTSELARTVLGQAARYQGATWNHPQLLQHSWLNRATPESGAGFANLSRQLLPNFLERYGDQLESEVISGLELAIQHSHRWWSEVVSDRCLVHGDLRLDNLLISPEPTHPDEAPNATLHCWIVDWQTATLGNGLADVAYFIGGNLLPDARQQCEKQLLTEHHEQLQAHGAVGLTWEQYQERYRHGAAYGIYLAVVAAMMVEQTERGDQMFITSTTRHVQHTLELGTFEPYGSTS